MVCKLAGPSPGSVGGNELTPSTFHLSIHLVSPSCKRGSLPATCCGGWKLGSLQLKNHGLDLPASLLFLACLFCMSSKPLEGTLCREEEGYSSCDKKNGFYVSAFTA